MTLLLDTHAFLWWASDPKLLSSLARKVVGDGKNTIYISAAVVWEIAIKQSLGKLRTPVDIEKFMDDNRFRPLPVTIPHALVVRALPPLHRDPFDRLLVAQATYEGFKIVTRDPQILRYNAPHVIA